MTRRCLPERGSSHFSVLTWTHLSSQWQPRPCLSYPGDKRPGHCRNQNGHARCRRSYWRFETQPRYANRKVQPETPAAVRNRGVLDAALPPFAMKVPLADLRQTENWQRSFRQNNKTENVSKFRNLPWASMMTTHQRGELETRMRLLTSRNGSAFQRS